MVEQGRFFLFFILFYGNRFMQQQRSQEGSYVHKRLIANINLGPFKKTKTPHNSYIYNYMHRRRKILKVGGAKDMIAHAKRARIFQTTPTLGQTTLIFERSTLLRLDFLHKRTNGKSSRADLAAT